jgi:hypothetical protein
MRPCEVNHLGRLPPAGKITRFRTGSATSIPFLSLVNS